MSQLYQCGSSPEARGAGLTVHPTPATLVVDIHCHMVVPAAETLARPHLPVVPDSSQRFASAESRTLSKSMNASIRESLTTVGQRLSAMDRAGIDIQVVSPAPGHYCYWADAELGRDIAVVVNDGLAEVAQSHSGRFMALGTVPLQAPELAVAELRRCVRQLGMKGIEISTNVAGVELSDPKFRPFFAAAEELGALLFMHPAGFTHGDRLSEFHLNNVIGNPLDTTVALSHLIYGGVLDSHPGLKLCVAHGGGMIASYTGRFDHAHTARSDCAHCKHPPSHYLRKMFFDTVVFDPDQLRWLIKKFGARHVLAGSDYPYDMAEKDIVGFVNGSGLSSDDAASILGLNAARLLGIDPETALAAARR